MSDMVYYFVEFVVAMLMGYAICRLCEVIFSSI